MFHVKLWFWVFGPLPVVRFLGMFHVKHLELFETSPVSRETYWANPQVLI